jgi:ubiquinone/menaquinone biosynthesis C-methylase UbiE
MATPFALNPSAARGFQNASNYDAHRPSYPAEAMAKLLAHLGVKGQKNARVIDLACGTGKFTELLAKREEEFEVVGIEPHVDMRDELVKKALKGVRVQKGDAGHIPIEDGWGDALIAAQVSCSSGNGN